MSLLGRSGFLLVLSSPSGTGKTTLIQALLKADPKIKLSISVTTRPRRPQEVEGRDYVFMSREQFQHQIDRHAFLEYAEVFGNYYGTPISELQQSLSQGNDVMLDLDWQGAQKLRERFPGQVVTVFILPPSLKILHHRLITRASDSPEVIQIRLAGVAEDLQHCADYDYVLVNETVQITLDQLGNIVVAERLRGSRQDPQFVQAMLKESMGISPVPTESIMPLNL